MEIALKCAHTESIATFAVRPMTDEMSSMFVSRHQLTRCISGEEEASRSNRSLSTADFSQQTVQDGTTQTPVPLRLCSVDVDDDGIAKSSTSVRVLSDLDETVTTCLQTMAPESWGTRLMDNEGRYLSFFTLIVQKSDNLYFITQNNRPTFSERGPTFVRTTTR